MTYALVRMKGEGVGKAQRDPSLALHVGNKFMSRVTKSDPTNRLYHPRGQGQRVMSIMREKSLKRLKK